jgi:hypothetical protein
MRLAFFCMTGTSIWWWKSWVDKHYSHYHILHVPGNQLYAYTILLIYYRRLSSVSFYS